MVRGGKSQNPNDPMPRRADNPVKRKPSQNLNDHISKFLHHPISELILAIATLLGAFGIQVQWKDFLGVLLTVLLTVLLVVISLGFAVLIFVLVKRWKQNRQSIDPSQRNSNKHMSKSRIILTIISLAITITSIAVLWHLSSNNTHSQVMVIGGNNSSNIIHSYVDVKYSQDGIYIVAIKDDGTVNLWNAADGTLLHTYNSHDNAIHTIAMSQDDKRIALGDTNGIVQILNATNGKPVSYNGKPVSYGDDSSGSVNAVAWSPDGTHLASVYNDGTVQVRETGDGAPIYTYNDHKKAVKAVAWSPIDVTYIAFGSDDGTVQIWDILSKKPVFYNGKPVSYDDGSDKSVYDKSVNAVAWSTNGKRIASSSNDGTMHIWEAATGGPNINDQYGQPGKVAINAVAWSSDSDSLYIAYVTADGTVQEYNSVNHSQLTTFPINQGGTQAAIVWSPDLSRIVSIGNDGTVREWNTKGRIVCNLPNTLNKKCS